MSNFRVVLCVALLATVLIAIVLTCILNLPAILMWGYGRWEVGQPFDQRTFDEPRFTLRITAFHQRGAVMAAPGAFYRYEVRAANDHRWRTRVMLRGSRPEPISADRLRSVSDSCAYFFHEHIFGMTTDGGVTWSIQGGEHPPIVAGQTFSHAQIETVDIQQDGAGAMRLLDYDPVLSQWGLVRNLITADYGRTWTA